MDRDTPTTRSATGAENFLDQAPKVSDALKRGVNISVTTWSGRTVLGVVSDRDTAGLLLNVEENGADGYAFLPWSSVERIDIPEVAHRQVKSLHS